MTTAQDKYKYFRIEAPELLEGISQAVLEIERSGPEKDSINRVLRLAHTLKGASRIVKQSEIAEMAHSIEEVFVSFRERGDPLSKEQINRTLNMLDVISVKVAALDQPVVKTSGEIPRAAMEEMAETVRIEINEADMLLDGVSEAGVQLTTLRREIAGIEHARQLAGSLLENCGLHPEIETTGTMASAGRARELAQELCTHLERLDRGLTAGIGQVESEFAQVRDAANRLRLMPVSTIFSSLERAVRDAAQTLQKNVLFEPTGGDIRLDTHVLTALRDALLHVVRNAVAHGIENPQERIAAEKPVQGCVKLRVERRGNRAAFICSDDGRGIDVKAVLRVAINRGLVTAEDAASLGLEEVVQIIMQGGFSTSQTVDEVSGRGIGLDVVREMAARLKGEAIVRSEPGKGTSIEILVPVSLASLAALEVNAGGTITMVPLDSIRRILRLSHHDITYSAEKESIIFDGKAIPFFMLTSVLRRKPSVDKTKQFWPAFVLEDSSGMAAIGVDRLLGTTSVVVRSLPLLVEAEAVVAGASLDAEGNPQLVLDPQALLAATRRGGAQLPESLPAKRPPVLVIDDSLTTRMLEQSILESAGYEVDLATSGEEGLRKAGEKQYGLFLVDVEMPGIDGFEFVSRTRSDAQFRNIPAILVTSLNRAEDRRRGEKAGAHAYIVKGEFDQGFLLRTISELIG